ncbi:MAG: hypothetical protein ACJAS1_002572 [Oleiphilaceae bacterium]|jgi:hypothetical protein
MGIVIIIDFENHLYLYLKLTPFVSSIKYKTDVNVIQFSFLHVMYVLSGTKVFLAFSSQPLVDS